MLIRGGSSAINMFSNSKMSQIDPRGGVSIFQISLKLKKVSNIRQAYLRHCPKFSCFLIMTPPLSVCKFVCPSVCLSVKFALIEMLTHLKKFKYEKLQFQTFKFSKNGQNEHEELCQGLKSARGGQGGYVGGQQAQSALNHH